MDNVMLPIIGLVVLIMGFVGGCDRDRLRRLEDSSREYRERIHNLEMDVLKLRFDPELRGYPKLKGGAA